MEVFKMFKKVLDDNMLNDCYTVRKKVFVEEQNVPLANEIDDKESISYHIIGYKVNGEPFATARIRPIDNYSGKIERVAITKENRGLGYGIQLMEAIEEIAKDLNFKELMMHAQTQAQGFYTRLGYSTHGETFIEENIEHIIMKKTME
ncbi:GNAT family N-acetyltransferase [Staphylococcus caprae]|nr:GNAT family N-acetyltransferase [Staphylococcus caprae]HCG74234.1 GNAT family N-acetyltransferase [Staphylococcus sp.]